MEKLIWRQSLYGDSYWYLRNGHDQIPAVKLTLTGGKWYVTTWELWPVRETKTELPPDLSLEEAQAAAVAIWRFLK